MKETGLPTLEQLRDGTADGDQLARAYDACMACYRRPCYPHFFQVETWVGEDRALIESGELDAFPRYHRSLLCRALWCLAHEEVLERRAVCARVVEAAALECASDEEAAGNRGIAAVFRSIAQRADAEASALPHPSSSMGARTPGTVRRTWRTRPPGSSPPARGCSRSGPGKPEAHASKPAR